MRRVNSVIRRIEATILSVAMMAVAAITIANVLARNLFDRNFAAAEELNRFLIVVICFVGLSYAAGQGRHIRMTALYDQLGRRARKAVMIVISATTAALMFALSWFALSYAWSVDKTSPVLGVPLAFVFLVAPLGLFLAGVQYLLALARNLIDNQVYVAYDRTDEPDLEPSIETGP